MTFNIEKSDYTNSFMLNSLKLPIIKDIDSLSDNIGLSKKVIYLLSTQNYKYYNTFSIRKKDGTARIIASPKYSMKLIQRWILKEILEKVAVSEQSTAFKPGVGNGAVNNANVHRYKLYLLQVDIQDFFTSIKREKVYYIFRSIGYNSLISNIFANICTYKGYLPQGGVCSPYLSNLTCYKLDKRIKGLCDKRDILFTRYADDITLSSDDKIQLKKVYQIIEEIINDEGFKLNHNKTRFLSPNSHKVITGITVNDRNLKASKEIKRKVRHMIHHSIVSCDYKNNDIIRGYVAYVDSVENEYRNRVIKYINNLIVKEYKYFPDVVQAYNVNKFFKEANDMNYGDIKLLEREKIDEILFKRYHFLLEHKYIDDSYDTWVKSLNGNIRLYNSELF